MNWITLNLTIGPEHMRKGVGQAVVERALRELTGHYWRIDLMNALLPSHLPISLPDDLRRFIFQYNRGELDRKNRYHFKLDVPGTIINQSEQTVSQDPCKKVPKIPSWYLVRQFQVNSPA